MEASTIFGLCGLGLGIVIMILDWAFPDPRYNPRIINQMDYNPDNDQD